MIIMIPRDTAFPCQKKHFFTTTEDNQTEFPIKIFEGDQPMTVDNEYLGQFILDGLPQGTKAGSLKIEVLFDVDGNRNLTVTTSEATSGRLLKARISVDWLTKVNYDEVPTQQKQG